ncbi:shikimate dehydrogenase [Hasllibacter halocynthiae]|uniref:Shikimate dehydrogenase (NADP(+)) n=1 Tax=Hasllibacter halocynthiae TaxID=595589 RepID=A0A2T0X2F8_9RHOB|nr:shikimate dehydrogenase [Hasllibacter halocynthiae]PRY93130.1 shikimate dehydrogenase [Hasllibacter halocynthiae]
MTDRIPLAGVLGAPVSHSRSPALHAHWLRSLGLRGHYVPIHVENEDLARVLGVLPGLGFAGVNVTVPLKERALELAEHVTDRAALIGAANTLTFRADGTVHADNTDGHGFIQALRQGAPDWSPGAGPAAVLGAGGAARAVVAALLEAGVPEVRVANRSRGRADALRADFGPRVSVVDWGRAGSIFDDAALAVNTTSLGMTGQPPLRVPLDGIGPGAAAMDLVYAPLRTPFLQEAAAGGAVTVDGLGMLVHQGAPGFERWFGKRPMVDEAARRAALGFG